MGHHRKFYPTHTLTKTGLLGTANFYSTSHVAAQGKDSSFARNTRTLYSYWKSTVTQNHTNHQQLAAQVRQGVHPHNRLKLGILIIKLSL